MPNVVKAAQYTEKQGAIQATPSTLEAVWGVILYSVYCIKIKCTANRATRYWLGRKKVADLAFEEWER